MHSSLRFVSSVLTQVINILLRIYATSHICLYSDLVLKHYLINLSIEHLNKYT